jgi:serine/threonine protein kinase
MIERGELDFTLGREIGAEGRNSRVFEATDHQLNALIAVKQIPRRDFNDEAEYFREAQRLYDSRHPNVVQVRFACRARDYVYIAMPLYQRSVQGLLESRELTVREIVRYGLGALTGLHHVHTRGLVHLDVKPSNILLDASDHAALTDFGLSRYVDQHGLAEQDIMYRLHRTPEALIATQVTAASDIYQAGLTLYRMATGIGILEDQWGRFGNETDAFRAVLEGTLPDRTAKAYPAHIPHRLRATIRRALEVDPDGRPATVLEMINDLAEVDQFLDWQYSFDAATGKARWVLRTQTNEKEITLEERNASTFEVVAKTRTLANGRERTSHKLSGIDLTRAAAHDRVRTALADL